MELHTARRLLAQTIRQFGPVSAEDVHTYTAAFTPFHAPAGSVLTVPGTVEQYLYFVLEGVQKSVLLHNDTEHVIALTYPNTFTGIPESYLTQTPSQVSLEVITESAFLRISFLQDIQFLETNLRLAKLMHLALAGVFKGAMQRYYELASLTIQERFERFMERSPQLFQLVPQKDIAAYLRIHPTNLSKLLRQWEGSVSHNINSA